MGEHDGHLGTEKIVAYHAHDKHGTALQVSDYKAETFDVKNGFSETKKHVSFQ